MRLERKQTVQNQIDRLEARVYVLEAWFHTQLNREIHEKLRMEPDAKQKESG